MNLLQIRTKLLELSGRADLVNPDYTDNGADFFINEGRKFLDRLTETQKSWAIAYKFLDVGEYLITFPYCRSIKEVWVSSTIGSRQLEKKDLQDILATYRTKYPNTSNTGTPYYYSPCISRTSPEDMSEIEKTTFAPFVEIPSKISGDTNAIIVNIPTDIKLAVEVKGLFYSKELVNNTDSNYWTEVHPLLLYMAAMRALEIINRNTQGVNDWSKSISIEISQLGMDLIDEIISEVNQIED